MPGKRERKVLEDITKLYKKQEQEDDVFVFSPAGNHTARPLDFKHLDMKSIILDKRFDMFASQIVYL